MKVFNEFFEKFVLPIFPRRFSSSARMFSSMVQCRPISAPFFGDWAGGVGRCVDA
jgi:hypothetical protein